MHCPKDTVVWVDPQSGMYYFKENSAYGRSGAGRYACRGDADLVGIPHVEFAVAVDGSVARLSEGDTRVLALQSFLDTYREPLAPEIQPDPSSVDGATVIRLLPRPAAL